MGELGFGLKKLLQRWVSWRSKQKMMLMQEEMTVKDSDFSLEVTFKKKEIDVGQIRFDDLLVKLINVFENHESRETSSNGQ